MSDDFKKEARKQYFKYFRIWFIVVGILGVVTLAAGIVHSRKGGVPRTNQEAPEERVYDYADMLTDQEEEELRQYISKKEEQLGIDIVLVTMSQEVEGEEARQKYGYRSSDWEQNMQDLADDFWDENRYGYNKGFEGDGVILLDNRYPGQRGEHLGTSGKVEYSFSTEDINSVMDAVDQYYDSDPYEAYRAYIDTVCVLMDQDLHFLSVFWLAALIVPAVTACIYAAIHLHQTPAEDTTAVNAYVSGGKPLMHGRRDDFVRKSTVTRRIETSSTGGGSHSGGGGGGHHVSSSGASHGGGSRRH